MLYENGTRGSQNHGFSCLGSTLDMEAMGRGLMLKVPVAARSQLTAALVAEYDGFEKKRKDLRNMRRGNTNAED